ncbi:unnamed protein product [Rangifer tarandus platyrhynchus]|uniref:Uncharacterized protein n=1 Tax=Rangifer tarandus platyrhynchus TaxID=3082113 RepID=A0ABN8YGT1_RANTA|nr:unnamed protein product [Rangifer tarandus platyrhynchus]
MKCRRWEGGENTLLRRKTHINERTLTWMLRKPSLTFQLPYTQLNKRPPCPKHSLHSLGRSEPWSNPLVCVCVCVCVVCVRARAIVRNNFGWFPFFSFHLLKILLDHDCCLSFAVVSWPRMEASGTRKHHEGGPLWVPVLQLDIPAVCV